MDKNDLTTVEILTLLVSDKTINYIECSSHDDGFQDGCKDHYIRFFYSHGLVYCEDATIYGCTAAFAPVDFLSEYRSFYKWRLYKKKNYSANERCLRSLNALIPDFSELENSLSGYADILLKMSSLLGTIFSEIEGKNEQELQRNHDNGTCGKLDPILSNSCPICRKEANNYPGHIFAYGSECSLCGKRESNEEE